MYYRVLSGGIGIYKAVERDSPKDDPRRKNKPNGSWVLKKGKEYSGAISFWTEEGMKRYINSGLLDWHNSVVSGEVYVLSVEKTGEILYSDRYQIICELSSIEIEKKENYLIFLKKFKHVF